MSYKIILDGFIKEAKSGRTFVVDDSELEKKYKTPMLRAMQAGTGLGMIRGNITPVKSAITGRANLWHGTPIENLLPNKRSEGILREGFSTRFAGQNKRLNRDLLANAFVRDTEEFLKRKGVKLTKYREAKIHVLAEDLVKRLKETDRNVGEYILDEANKVAKAFDVKADELRNFYKKKMPDMGARLYFGSNPQGVAFWAHPENREKKSILDRIAKGSKGSNRISEQMKAQSRIMAESLAEQATGGYYGDIRARMSYGKPAVKKVETLSDAAKIVKEYAEKGKGYNAILKTHLPAKGMSSMKDFPGIRHLVTSFPGVKNLLARYLPNMDPSKDLSVAHNISPDHINMIDIVDDKGKAIKRIKIKNYKKAPISLLGGSGNRLKTLKRAAIPSLLTAGGLSLLYNAVTDKKISDLFMEKKSSVDPKMVAKLALIPAAAELTSAGVGSLIGKSLGIKPPKVISVKEYEGLSDIDKYKHRSKEYKYLRNKIPLDMLAMSGLGAGTGALLLKRAPYVGSLLGAYIGTLSGSMSEGRAKQIRRMQTDPAYAGGVTSLAAQMPTLKKQMQKHPELSSTINNAILAGTALSVPYYAARKYYPYHVVHHARELKKHYAKPIIENIIQQDKALKKMSLMRKAGLIGVMAAFPAIAKFFSQDAAMRMDELGTKGKIGLKKVVEKENA